MKRRSLLIVIALLAMASIMASMAYTRAYVANATTFAVVQTDKAKLAIIENENHKGVAKIYKNKMVLDFSKGMQPGSKYFYDDLFYIKNNTDKDMYVGLRFENCYTDKGQVTNYPVGLHTVSTNKPLTNTSFEYNNSLILGGSAFRSGAYEGRMIVLKSGEQIGIDFSFVINETTDLLYNDKIVLQVHSKDAPNGAWH